MINQRGTVGYLDKDVLSQGQIVGNEGAGWRHVVVEQILCDAGALCLPVEPETAGAVMEMVAANDDVDGGVHLDAADFRTGQILLVVDMMDVIVLNDGEDAT